MTTTGPGPLRAPRRRAAVLAALLVALAGLAAHWSGLGGAFVFDDMGSIVGVAEVQHPDPWWRAFTAPEGSGASGRPLVAASLALDHVLGGGGPRSFHVTNLVLHLAAALALFELCRRALAGALGPRRALGCAWASTTLWVVHPLHTAALWHVVYRNETMLALFALLALLCAERRLAGGGPRWSILCVLAALAAAASKEPAAALPLLVLAYDRAFHAGGWRLALRRHPRLYAGLAGTWPALALFLATGTRGASVGAGAAGVSPGEYLLTQTGVLVRYLRLALLPDDLVFDYHGWPLSRTFADAMPAGLVVLGLLVLTAWALVRRPRFGVAGLLFFAVLAPTSSVIPITGAVCAEHRMVLPLVGLIVPAVVGAALVLERIPRRAGPRLGLILVLVAAAPLAAVSARRGLLFADPLALWRDTIAKRPDNARAYENLGALLARAGRSAEAEEALLGALAVRDDRVKAWSNLALLRARGGRAGAALVAARRALALAPDDRGMRLLEARLVEALGLPPGGSPAPGGRRRR